jgi:hypothetical protein
MTPAINPCHGFSVIAGVVDTGNKFIAGVVNLLRPMNSYCRGGPLISLFEVSMDVPFHGGSNDNIGAHV